MNPLSHLSAKDESRVSGFLTISSFDDDGKLIYQSEPLPNKVVSSDGYGRNLLIRALAGDATFPLAITTISLGTGSTAPVDANIGLQTPTATLIPITEMVVTNNQLIVRCYVADANLANGTYSELAVNCGTRLFAHIIIAPSYTKAALMNSRFDYTLTLTG